MPLIPAKYVEAVNAGVKFLDMVVGRKKWLGRMNMRKFEIDDPSTCVAGNIFRDAYFKGETNGFESFQSAISALGGNGEKLAYTFGFNAGNEKGMQYLQDLWVMKIKQLKARVR